MSIAKYGMDPSEADGVSLIAYPNRDLRSVDWSPEAPSDHPAKVAEPQCTRSALLRRPFSALALRPSVFHV